MSFFGKLLGNKKHKSPEKKKKNIAKVILELKGTEDLLIKKKDDLQRKIVREKKIAKENGTKNKKVTIPALKRIKQYENQLQQTEGILRTVEEQINLLDQANINSLVTTSVKATADALKQDQKNWDVDKVEQMLEEIANEKDRVDEITDALAHTVGFADEFDEDELERELNELSDLEQLELDKTPEKPELPKIQTPKKESTKKVAVVE